MIYTICYNMTFSVPGPLKTFPVRPIWLIVFIKIDIIPCKPEQ